VSIVAPGAESLDDAQSGYLRNDKTVRSPWSELNAVYPIEGGTLIRSESFKDYNTIKIKPGIYRVQLKVRGGGGSAAFPVTTVNVLAGKTYLFSSVLIMDRQAVKAVYKEIDTSDYRGGQ